MSRLKNILLLFALLMSLSLSLNAQIFNSIENSTYFGEGDKVVPGDTVDLNSFISEPNNKVTRDNFAAYDGAEQLIKSHSAS